MPRPQGSNADEWALFLREHADAPDFLAVQIAEALDDVWRRARETFIGPIAHDYDSGHG